MLSEVLSCLLPWPKEAEAFYGYKSMATPPGSTLRESRRRGDTQKRTPARRHALLPRKKSHFPHRHLAFTCASPPPAHGGGGRAPSAASRSSALPLPAGSGGIPPRRGWEPPTRAVAAAVRGQVGSRTRRHRRLARGGCEAARVCWGGRP